MTVLFLSSYSKCTDNVLNQKKGYISNLILPFLKIYKKSILHIAKISNLYSKLSLNIYDKHKNSDLYLITRLLKLLYLKEQNIKKKRWIAEQLKKITSFILHKDGSKFNLKSGIPLERKAMLKNDFLSQRSNMIPIQKSFITKRSNAPLRNISITLSDTKCGEFGPSNSSFDPNKKILSKLDMKELIMNMIKLSSNSDGYRRNYFGLNSGMPLFSANSKFVSNSFSQHNFMFSKLDTEGKQRRNNAENYPLFLINASESKFPVTTMTRTSHTHCNGGILSSPNKQHTSTHIRLGKAKGTFTKDLAASSKWRVCSEFRLSKNIKSIREKFDQYNIDYQNEKVYKKYIPQQIRLKGPFEYRA